MDLNIQNWREELKEGTMWTEPQRQKEQVNRVLNTHAPESILNCFGSGKYTGQNFDVKNMILHSLLMVSASQARERGFYKLYRWAETIHLRAGM